LLKTPEKPSILVVDDSAENIHILFLLLKSDYSIMTAKSGDKAIQLARENAPDLILLDIIMPNLNGYDVCRQLKSDDKTKHIPIIFVTSMNEALDEAEAFGVGAVDYITKPINPITVLARVRTHINLKIKSDLLEQLASVDGLTNIHNRRKFDEVFEHEWKRAGRDQIPLSLIMIDIDYFKQFNDHYGHASGDVCLRKVAEALNRSLTRAGDRVFRYGGEEFVVILPNTLITGAKKVAEMLRGNVELLCIPHQLSFVSDNVTISLGVATALPSCDASTAVALLESADKMLYLSKDNGRNSVSCM